jgi:hypothetical protein
MIYNFWYHYEVPSLYGNGPEAVTELIVVGIVTALLIPPIRKWIQGEFHKVHSKIDAGHAELHAKMDHIIKHHPDIPEFKEPK